MAYQPKNLALRFVLELVALTAFGYWGWQAYGLIAAVAAPLIAATAWGLFAVPGDPSRSGGAPVPVPGWLRLVLEFAVLFGSAWALKSVGLDTMAVAFGVVISVHYVLSYDRIVWLVRR